MGNAQRHDGTPGFPFAFDLGDRLDKAMRVAGLGPDDMAEALDVSRNTIGNYRSGRTHPSKLQIKEWSVRTGAPLEWLLTGNVPDSDSNSRSWVPKVGGSNPSGGTMIPFPTRRMAASTGGERLAEVTPIRGGVA